MRTSIASVYTSQALLVFAVVLSEDWYVVHYRHTTPSRPWKISGALHGYAKRQVFECVSTEQSNERCEELALIEQGSLPKSTVRI